MKCIVCIYHSSANKNITIEVIQDAVDGAKEAVTVYNNEPLCVEHLRDKFVARAVREIANAG
jgi:hypothetical protein